MKFILSLFALTFLLHANAQRDTTFTSFEAAFEQPESVYRLDLSKKGLRKLPKAVSLLPNLEVLILTENSLTKFPAFLCEMKYLRFLDLGHNLIKSLPEEINQLNQLEFLSLSWNHSIDHSLENIGALLELKELKLDGLKIEKLPKSLISLKKLQSLDLSYNHFSEFPEIVYSLISLNSLILERNKHPIEMDDEMGQLTLLKKLVWSHNQSSKLPKNLSDLKHLNQLILTGNNFSDQSKHQLLDNISEYSVIKIEF